MTDIKDRPPPKTVRYCINCGREIGDAYFCPNPDCGRLPNFYRDIPGPDHRDRVEVRDERPATVATSFGHPAAPADLEPDRRTIQMQQPAVAFLKAVDPPHAEYPLQPGINEVGARRPAKVVIDRPEISSRHAAIIMEQGSNARWLGSISDHGSTNGTFLKGEQVLDRRTLADGDRIRFANIEFAFRLAVQEEPRLTIPLPPRQER